MGCHQQSSPVRRLFHQEQSVLSCQPDSSSLVIAQCNDQYIPALLPVAYFGAQSLASRRRLGLAADVDLRRLRLLRFRLSSEVGAGARSRNSQPGAVSGSSDHHLFRASQPSSLREPVNSRLHALPETSRLLSGALRTFKLPRAHHYSSVHQCLCSACRMH